MVELATQIHERSPTPPPPALPGGWAPLTTLASMVVQYAPVGGRPFFSTARAAHPVSGAPLLVLSICTFDMRAYVHRKWPLVIISLHRAEGQAKVNLGGPAIEQTTYFTQTQLLVWDSTATGSAPTSPTSWLRTLVSDHVVELYIEEQPQR